MDRGSEAEADQHILTHLKFLTCMALGHGTGCLGKTGTSIGVAAAAIFALTGGGGEGPGGGFRGEGPDGALRGEGSGGGGPGLRTASEAGIAPNDAKRIQNAADKAGQPIIVVGSRAGNGNLNPTSDWDYILTGPSRTRHSVKNSLPRGTGDGEGSGRGRDFYQSYNPNSPRKDYTVLDTSKPYVVFEPRG